MKKPILLIAFLSLVVVSLTLARITLVNTISTTGVALVNIQNQIEDLKHQNEILKEEYLSEAAYTTIDNKATKLGYAPVQTQIDLSTPPPLALQ